MDISPHERLKMAVYSRSFPYLSHAGPIPMSNDELETRLLFHGRLFRLIEQQLLDNYTSVFSMHLTPEPQFCRFADRFAARIRSGEFSDPHTFRPNYVLSRTSLEQPNLKLRLLHKVGELRLYGVDDAAPSQVP